jgi:hypothetical protein
MKRSNKETDMTEHNQKNPVRENKPNSIGDGLKSSDKQGYPYPEEQGKQFDDQPEFIDPANNNSKTKNTE